jgi:hypothetical protein
MNIEQPIALGAAFDFAGAPQKRKEPSCPQLEN